MLVHKGGQIINVQLITGVRIAETSQLQNFSVMCTKNGSYCENEKKKEKKSQGGGGGVRGRCVQRMEVIVKREKSWGECQGGCEAFVLIQKKKKKIKFFFFFWGGGGGGPILLWGGGVRVDENSKKNWVGGGIGRRGGGAWVGGQGVCERLSGALVKIQKRFFLGAGGGGGGGGG